MSPYCLYHRLQSAHPPVSPPVAEPAETPDLFNIPWDYHNLQRVFCKGLALALPPHRPYDCSIDPLPGSGLPSSRLFNLSHPEREALEKYIHDSSWAGVIHPSSSPLGAQFFFVQKKDGTARLCIDYRGLNNITAKNKYSLPLISSFFEAVWDATIFTKLDLQNAYHLVQIKEGDEWKTAFKTHIRYFKYLVMPFGLCNTPAVLQALINNVLRDFLYSFVFIYLDNILIYSRNLQEHRGYIKKVLQRLLESRLYVKAEQFCPVSHHFHFLPGWTGQEGHKKDQCSLINVVHFIPAGKNYNIGSWRMQTLAAGCWASIIIWTDHKNLSYLQSAKCFNPRQSRVSRVFLFFSLFTITYRPGARKFKLDGLSWQFSTDEPDPVPDLTLPKHCTVGGLTWDLENQIR